MHVSYAASFSTNIIQPQKTSLYQKLSRNGLHCIWNKTNLEKKSRNNDTKNLTHVAKIYFDYMQILTSFILDR